MRALTVLWILLLAAGTAAADGKTIYVSPEGKNSNDGAEPANPVKSLWKGIELAGDGGTVLIAEGEYTGRAKSGRWELTASVTLRGGFDKEFTVRDPFTQPTLLVGDGNGNSPLVAEAKAGIEIVIDGVTINGESVNDYSQGYLGFRETQVPLILCKTIGKKSAVTVRNCVLLNSSNSGIHVNSYVGPIKLHNNVLAGCRPTGIEVSTNNRGPITIEQNTIAFSWTHGKTPPHTGGTAVRVVGRKGTITIRNNLFAHLPESAVQNVDGANEMINLRDNVTVECEKGLYLTRINRKEYRPGEGEMEDADLLDVGGNRDEAHDFGLPKTTVRKIQKLYAPLLELDEIKPFLPSDKQPDGAGARKLKS